MGIDPDRYEAEFAAWLNYWSRNAQFLPPDPWVADSPQMIDLAKRLDEPVEVVARCLEAALARAGFERARAH